MRMINLNLFLLMMLLPLMSIAEEVYRTKDDRGQVIFSDTPIPTGQSIETIELQPGPSEQSIQDAEARQKALRARLDTMQKERAQKEAIQAGRIRQASKALEVAEKNLEKAKEMRSDDWQVLVGGRRRLKAEYFERIKAAEARLEAARMRLREAQTVN